MCNCAKDGCQRPEEFLGKPEDCTEEQIIKCHGSAKNHPCQSKPEKK
ncbi:hypothetical protein [Dethiosulfatarculus sandiegensis]|uniref:Uncharacterized protein n=1 Tax=Dethiosulfatarculus sandiegensis TaxID=1429043 RepID=A0A0D2HRD9_9BACT|nr:hypothetical protein [Dethiosulfatarculus sandiegensis]KIX13128.1 hypothetical protein X474_15635 [Dethiosulfatarculus sandiegensis]